MTSRTALVVGATGIVGLNLATHLADQQDWRVYGFPRLLIPRATAAAAPRSHRGRRTSPSMHRSLHR